MVENIGYKIMMALREKNWEQKELARRAGISEGAVSYYIANKRSPRFELLTRIARALHKPITYFVESSEEELKDSGLENGASVFRSQPSLPVFDSSDVNLRSWIRQPETTATLPSEFGDNNHSPKPFFVCAQGETMLGRIDENRCICRGDLLLVDPDREVADGSVCFCWYEGEGARVGRYKIFGEELYLISLHENFKPVNLKFEVGIRYYPITEIISTLQK